MEKIVLKRIRPGESKRQQEVIRVDTAVYDKLWLLSRETGSAIGWIASKLLTEALNNVIVSDEEE